MSFRDGYPHPDNRMNRRALLLGGGAAVLAVYLGVNGSGDHQAAPEKGAVLNTFPETFENDSAQSVARGLHINPGAYFKVPAETMHEMADGKFIHHSELLPIFPPAVQKYKDTITEVAEETGLPVNFLATIATIESAGNAEALSGADAWGLVQVVPRYHLDRYVKFGYLPPDADLDDYQNAKAHQPSVLPLHEYRKALVNPEASLRVGADYLKECLEAARHNQPYLDPDSPIIYAWAASAYNGGVGLTKGTYENMPEQARLYVNHVIRILMDVEIAARLKDKGMSDKEVLKALWSEEMNARAYAYGKLANVEDYDARAEFLTEPLPGLPAKAQAPHGMYARQAYDDYEAYLKGDADVPSKSRKFVIPAAPGLRIWLQGGGASLFNGLKANADWRVS